MTENRVGESGQVKTIDFDNIEDAKQEFEKRFKSKTGLAWENRTDEPKNNKYTFVERAYDDEGAASAESDAADTKNDDVDRKSDLDMDTQRLMELIFKFDIPSHSRQERL